MPRLGDGWLVHFRVADKEVVADLGELPSFRFNPVSHLRFRCRLIKQHLSALFFVLGITQALESLPRIPKLFECLPSSREVTIRGQSLEADRASHHR